MEEKDRQKCLPLSCLSRRMGTVNWELCSCEKVLRVVGEKERTRRRLGLLRWGRQVAGLKRVVGVPPGQGLRGENVPGGHQEQTGGQCGENQVGEPEWGRDLIMRGLRPQNRLW